MSRTDRDGHVPIPQSDDYPDAEVVDMTNRSGTSLVSSMADLPLAAGTKCIELGLCRVGKIEGLDQCPSLVVLTLRGNTVKKIEGLEPCGPTLQRLDLYGNEIDSPEGLEVCTALRHLDLSFNEIRDLDRLEVPSPDLEELYVINNKLRTAGDALKRFPKLRLLELGSNRLRDAQGIEHLPLLEQIFLGRNKLTEIPPQVSGLRHLRVLSLQSNRIERIDGVPECVEELYLAHNGIARMENLSHLRCLRVLELDANRIEHLDTEGLGALEELWVASNKISAWEEVAGVAQHCPGLKTIYLEHNPIQEGEPRYRAKVREAIPSLEQIDAEMIIHMP